MTLDQLAQAGSALGVAGLLFASLFGLYRQWWVPGWTYQEKVKEAEEWKAIAMRGMETTQNMAEAAKGHTILTREEADSALRVIREAGRAGQ